MRRLARQPSERAAERAFVIEGAGLTADALDSGLELHQVYFTWDAPGDLVDRARAEGVEVVEVSPAAIESMATTVTPQPVVAVSALPNPIPMTGVRSHIVVLDGVQDPGNLGTILRSAEASGAEKVVLTSGSVDVYSPKVVRSSAGAIFRVAVERNTASAEEAIALAKSDSRPTYGAVAHGELEYDQVDLTEAVIVFGNESSGLDESSLAQIDHTVAIPQRGDLDSLNVAMAATVMCFEAARQRRHSG